MTENLFDTSIFLPSEVICEVPNSDCIWLSPDIISQSANNKVQPEHILQTCFMQICSSIQVEDATPEDEAAEAVADNSE